MTDENDGPEDENKPAPMVTIEGRALVSDIFGLGAAVKSKTAEHVVQALSAAVGGIAEPALDFISTRLQGAAKRQELRADLKLASELEQTYSAHPEIVQATRKRLLATEFQRTVNIDAAAAKAITYAEEQTEEPKASIRPDFAQQWIDGVKDVSDEELRSMWARLMAEAPKATSGSIELPVLQLLGRFDRAMANAFKEVAAFFMFAEKVCPSVFEVNTDERFRTLELLIDAGAIRKEQAQSVRFPLFRSTYKTFTGNLGAPRDISVISLSVSGRLLGSYVSGELDFQEPLAKLTTNPDQWIGRFTRPQDTNSHVWEVDLANGLKRVFQILPPDRSSPDFMIDAEEKVDQIEADTDPTSLDKLRMTLRVWASQGRLSWVKDEPMPA